MYAKKFHRLDEFSFYYPFFKVQYAFVRNLLHKRFPESLNKTSRACQRRINYMLKNPATVENVSLFLADLEQDANICSQFTDQTMKECNEQQQEAVFEKLVDKLVEKYKSGGGGDGDKHSKDRLKLPSTLTQLKANYSIVFPSSSIGDKETFKDPNSVQDIQESVVSSVIMSSLSATGDKTNWAYHLFKIYQQYPDAMLRSVMQKMRLSKMVSVKKTVQRSKVKTGNYLPLSSSPYQLSVSFTHKFLNRYHFDIYQQSWHVVKELAVNKEEGYEVIINEEGGYAAAVVSLMAKNRLLFQTEVPQQVIVLDPNLALVDEAYVRILQRYKELLRNAGNMDEDDMNIMTEKHEKPTKGITVRALLSKDKKMAKKPSKVAPVSLETPKSQSFDDGIVFRGQGSSEEERSHLQVAKCASRIALYLMREELKEGSKESNTEQAVQHSHDYFVVSSCRISAKLDDFKTEEQQQKLTFGSGKQKVSIPSSLLPGKVPSLTKILNKFGLNVYGAWSRETDKLKTTCLDLKSVSVEDVLAPYSGAEKQDLALVYQAILDGKELGASGSDLKTLKLKKRSLASAVQTLLDANAVIRTGVTTLRIIAACHADPWILHSFKMSRLQREAAPDTKFTEKTFAAPAEKEEPKKEETRRSGRKAKPEPEESTTTTMSSAAKKVAWDKVDVIDLFSRPWIRVDGTLNRKVLDRMLGAVLGCVMQKPGQVLTRVTQKFAPAIQPFQTRELIEILQEMGCLKMLKLQKPEKKCSLFHKPELATISEATLLDDSDDIIVEPSVDGVVILGQFIGDKQYSCDIYQCPCHPKLI